MAEGGFPNRNQADNALTIYRDAMRGYVAQALAREHGPDWTSSQLLNSDVGGRASRWTERLQQDYEHGVPAQNLLDVAESPRLIELNHHAFPDLDVADIQRMQEIRQLRNEVAHSHHGTCTRDVDAVVERCALVLECCDLPDAAEEIRKVAHAENNHG